MYGRLMRGVLVVETDEVEWLFEVHGKIPEYAPARMEARRSARRTYGRDAGGGGIAWQRMKVVKVSHADGALPVVGQGHREAVRGSAPSDDDSF
jgi:hypothetical protein